MSEQAERAARRLIREGLLDGAEPSGDESLAERAAEIIDEATGVAGLLAVSKRALVALDAMLPEADVQVLVDELHEVIAKAE